MKPPDTSNMKPLFNGLELVPFDEAEMLRGPKEGDGRNLCALNRRERQILKATERKLSFEQRRTTVVNLNNAVIAFDVERKIIELKKGEGAPKLKTILLIVLREVHHEIDTKEDHKQKTARYLLEKRIAPEDFDATVAPVEQIELTKEEAEMLKGRVGKFFLQGGVVGRVCELLDGAA